MKTNISFKAINTLAVPATIAGIAEPLLSLTDTAIVGNIPVNGLESLAAAGIVGSFLSTLIWILGQTQSAISALVSQHLGAGKINEVTILPAQAIFFNLVISFIILVPCLVFTETIFTALEASGTILAYCISYFKIRIWGFPLTLFTFAVFGVFRGLQNTLYPMLIAIIGALLNIVLDIILVFGVDDLISPMHLEGAGYASLIAQAVMAILAGVLLVKKTKISLQLRLPLHPKLGTLALMSANLFIRSFALNFALLLAVKEATRLGDSSIGAHTIAINLWLFSAFFIDGYATAGNILGGKLLGEKNYTNLWALTKKVSVYGLLISLVLAGLSVLFYAPIGSLFSNNPDVLSKFNGMFFMLIIALPINAIAFILDGLFKGLGEMKFLRNVLLFSTFIIFVPIIFISRAFSLNLVGIWLAFLGWMLARGFILMYQFRKKYRPMPV